MTVKKITVADDQIGVIALKQWEILRRFKEGTLTFDLLSFTLQNVIEGNFGGIVHPYFSLVNVGYVKTPENYESAKQLNTIYPRRDFCYFDSRITDKNFNNVSNSLYPNKKYFVKIFQVKKAVRFEKCLAFLKSHDAIFVGPQGLSLLWQQNQDIFPKLKYTISFDEKDKLWQDDKGRQMLPRMRREDDGDGLFDLAQAEDIIDSTMCLLCFCEC